MGSSSSHAAKAPRESKPARSSGDFRRRRYFEEGLSAVQDPDDVGSRPTLLKRPFGFFNSLGKPEHPTFRCAVSPRFSSSLVGLGVSPGRSWIHDCDERRGLLATKIAESANVALMPCCLKAAVPSHARHPHLVRR
eukprot:s1517_g11.t1